VLCLLIVGALAAIGLVLCFKFQRNDSTSDSDSSGDGEGNESGGGDNNVTAAKSSELSSSQRSSSIRDVEFSEDQTKPVDPGVARYINQTMERLHALIKTDQGWFLREVKFFRS